MLMTALIALGALPENDRGCACACAAAEREGVETTRSGAGLAAYVGAADADWSTGCPRREEEEPSVSGASSHENPALWKSGEVDENATRSRERGVTRGLLSYSDAEVVGRGGEGKVEAVEVDEMVPWPYAVCAIARS